MALAGCGGGGGGGDDSRTPAERRSTQSAQPPAAALCSRPAAAAKPALGGPALRQRIVEVARERGVFVGRADGSKLRRLTGIAGFEYQPDWSPDGRWLLLRVDGNGPDDPRGGVHVVSADGSRVRNLSGRMRIQGGSGDWSPDGMRIVFAGQRDGDTHPNLYIATADGARACRLTDDRFEAQYPAWSPDGRKIAFSRPVGNEDFDLGVFTLGQRDARPLTSGPEGDNWPEWSPDGRTIAFSRNDGELWLMDADGSSPRRLTEGGEHAWSPDGRWLGFNCSAGLCASRADGSQQTTLMRDGGFIAWKP